MQTHEPNEDSTAGRARATRHALVAFLALNAAAAAIASTRYLAIEGIGIASAAGAFAALAITSQLAVVSLVAALALRPLARVPAAAWSAAIAGAALLQLFLHLDRMVFGLYRFHVNGLVIDSLRTPGGWESMHIAGSDLARAGAGAALLVLSEIGAAAGLRRLAATRALPRRATIACAAAALSLAACDRALYAVADLESWSAIARGARLVPFYQPFTVKRFARAWLHVDAAAAPKIARAGGDLRYPREPLLYDAPAHRPSFLWIVLDSFRFDAMNPETTPRIAALAERSQVFENHDSGGNATRFGMFSMFYGLHGCYWQSVLADQKGPVLFDRLSELGYEVQILAGGPLTFPEFKRTIFVDVPPSRIDDDPPRPTTAAKDRELVEHFGAFTGALPAGQPFFAVMFFDSSHAPYDFEEPAAIYRPYAGHDYSALGDEGRRTLVWNRYRDAVHYLDGLVGEALDGLARQGRLDDTVVIVTGDHGEEFHEHGYWGHNGAFTPEQVHVPLVISLPGVAPKRWDKPTEHQDLAPTILGMLGAKNPPSDYSVGRPLFGEEPDPFRVSCGWDTCADLESWGSMTFGTEPYDASAIVFRDPEYREIDRAPATPPTARLMGEMSAFLR